MLELPRATWRRLAMSEAKMERIAAALERIADSLERAESAADELREPDLVHLQTSG